jgi:hypothetical protein
MKTEILEILIGIGVFISGAFVGAYIILFLLFGNK